MFMIPLSPSTSLSLSRTFTRSFVRQTYFAAIGARCVLQTTHVLVRDAIRATHGRRSPASTIVPALDAVGDAVLIHDTMLVVGACHTVTRI